MGGKEFLRKYLIWVMLLLGQLHGYKSCVENERQALLELKKYIISVTKEREFELKEDNVLTSWAYDIIDCCQWEGVMCNQTSKRVTGIAFGTLNLKESSLLNLSLLHPFEEIRSLNLSKSRFGFLYPLGEKIFNDETNNQFAGLFDDVEGHKSLGRLKNLEIMDLSSNKFNNSIFPFLSAATSLTTLILRDNYMDGSIPAKELRDLINLELLDLSINIFNGTVPVQEISSLMKLKALDLSDNEFSGSINLQGFCKLKNMEELDLSRNKLVSHFPSCLTSLSGLRVLDLPSNQMTGKLPSALSKLESLEYLSLFDNNFEGLFSIGLLSNLSELRVLKLGSKSNTLQVESGGSWTPRFQLNAIVLGSCNLDKVPHFLVQQKGLRQVDLSNNKISGNFPSWLMENNTELLVLGLQNNYLTSFQLPKSTHGLGFLDVSMNEFNHIFPENIGLILPQLMSLNISSNGFQGNLPSSLDNMETISYLDLSHNSFQGKIPRHFLKGCYSMQTLKLSHNRLSGEVFQERPFYSISQLLMDNNQFTGKIGKGLQNLQEMSLLDISNNSLTGVIPSWIGELQSLTALLLSNNSLEGEIPISLFNISTLNLLDIEDHLTALCRPLPRIEDHFTALCRPLPRIEDLDTLPLYEDFVTLPLYEDLDSFVEFFTPLYSPFVSNDCVARGVITGSFVRCLIASVAILEIGNCALVAVPISGVRSSTQDFTLLNNSTVEEIRGLLQNLYLFKCYVVIISFSFSAYVFVISAYYASVVMLSTNTYSFYGD